MLQINYSTFFVYVQINSEALTDVKAAGWVWT